MQLCTTLPPSSAIRKITASILIELSATTIFKGISNALRIVINASTSNLISLRPTEEKV